MIDTLHVVFRVGATEYVIPASPVLGMESYDGATPVPGAPAYLAGVIQVRGRIVPVIDLRVRFGLPPIPHSLDTRVVVVEHGGRVVGLLVDRAREVIRLVREQLEQPPAIVTMESGGFVAAIANVGPRMVMLVDLPSLIGAEEKQQHVQ